MNWTQSVAIALLSGLLGLACGVGIGLARPLAADLQLRGRRWLRFGPWLDAVVNLRDKCGADFAPELRTILELSRVRADSGTMRRDVCRVASYHMQQWTGLEPLPTDPKPR